ncbi:uncharacterized protein LOC119177751 isoform X2 [Rhipicephalus microplus]|uniref:uncharacterized protein LOC119177751 isoform X2 n=1 Tax=Rhipicephalus microplus TaxID=6941 RepID=UPI003F6B550A
MATKLKTSRMKFVQDVNLTSFLSKIKTPMNLFKRALTTTQTTRAASSWKCLTMTVKNASCGSPGMSSTTSHKIAKINTKTTATMQSWLMTKSPVVPSKILTK